MCGVYTGIRDSQLSLLFFFCGTAETESLFLEQDDSLFLSCDLHQIRFSQNEGDGLRSKDIHRIKIIDFEYSFYSRPKLHSRC